MALKRSLSTSRHPSRVLGLLISHGAGVIRHRLATVPPADAFADGLGDLGFDVALVQQRNERWGHDRENPIGDDRGVLGQFVEVVAANEGPPGVLLYPDAGVVVAGRAAAVGRMTAITPRL